MIILNEFGLAIWKNQYRPEFLAERAYSWCDFVLFMVNRQVYDSQKFSTFDFTGWRPVTVEEYKEMIKPANGVAVSAQSSDKA